MQRPYKVRNTRTGRTLHFASSDTALARVALLGNLPVHFQTDFVYIEDGVSYPIGPLIDTMRTLARIYDIGTAFVEAHAVAAASAPPHDPEPH